MRKFASITYICIVVAVLAIPLYFRPISLTSAFGNTYSLSNFNIEDVQKISIFEQLNFFHITGELPTDHNHYVFTSHNDIEAIYHHLSNINIMRRISRPTTFQDITHHYTLILHLSNSNEAPIYLINSDGGTLMELGSQRFHILIGTESFNEFHEFLLYLSRQ